MTEKPKPQRLSDVVKPGLDYAEKVKIDRVLAEEVNIIDIERVSGSPEFALVDAETGEIVSRDYWNVTVESNALILTFSTGAMPVDKVLSSLQHKIDTGEAELPLLATFFKEGKTYVVK